MSLFSRLFGSKKPAKPVVSAKAVLEQRAAALSELSIETLIDAIESKSQTVDWQVNAIARLPYESYLIGLITHKKNAKTYNAAALRVASFIDTDSVSIAQLNKDLENILLVASVASFCCDKNQLDNLVAAIEKETELVKLVEEGSTAKVRLTAANKLQDLALIKPLLQQLKHKDKTVHRILKDKLDVAREKNKAEADKENQLLRICESLEVLARKYEEPTFVGQLQRMEKKWHESVDENLSTTLHERYRQALAACYAPGEKAKQEQLVKAQKAQSNIDAENAYAKIQNELGVALGDFFSAENLEADITKLQTQVSQEKKTWQDVSKRFSADVGQDSQWVNLEQAIDSLTSMALNAGSLVQNISQLKVAMQEKKSHDPMAEVVKKYLTYTSKLPSSALSPSIIEAQSLLAEIERAAREARAEGKEYLRVIDGLVRKGNAAIERGSLRQACGIRKTISEKVLDEKPLSVSILRNLEVLDEAINKLQGYRDFSVEPKKLALIEKMQLLSEKSTSSKLNVESHANQIQQLQRDWKELVYGGKDMQPELWEQFQALSRTAYKPCEVYFSLRADERHTNLVLREALLKSLNEYLESYHWDQANWKDVEKILHTAKQEWAGFTPVDRTANTPLQKRFNQTVKSIQDFINVEYQKNSDAKQIVINSAEKLKDIENVASAIDQAKKLQVQWKSCGRTWPREENKLWGIFRAHCDAVFTRKGEEVAAFKAELQETKVQAESLCVSIEALLLLKGDSLLSAKTQLHELLDEFSKLGALPRDAEKVIKERFFSAKDHFDILVKSHRNSQKRLAWESVYTANKLVNQWQEFSCSQGNASESAVGVLVKLNEKIDSIDKWPAGTKKLIENKVADLITTQDKLVSNESILRLLCVRMEVVADAPTPAEDQALRMEHQVKRLQQGMAGVSASKEEQTSELLLEWLGAGPVNSVAYDLFWDRFSKHAL